VTSDFKLDPGTHESVYADIEYDVFKGLTASSQPRVIISGGQPGSGKSRLVSDSQKEFVDRNVAIINGDEYRQYHPAVAEICRFDDKRLAELTDPDCRMWTRRLFEAAIKSRFNIIFESTMRESGPITDTMKRLRSSGYQLTAKIIATHSRFSTTSIIMRYEQNRSKYGFGRWTPLASHDAGYDGLMATVKIIEESRLVDDLQVYNRSSEQIYSSSDAVTSAVSIIEQERERTPTVDEFEALKYDWDHILDLMTLRKAPEKDIVQAKQLGQKLLLEAKSLRSRTEEKQSRTWRSREDRER
jgi:hypothetical protein